MEEKLYSQRGYFEEKINVATVNNNSDVTHIYYDVLVTNNTNVNPENMGSVPLTFKQNRENPYLDRPEDYSATVPFFNLESSNFPLQTIQPQIGTVVNNNGTNSKTPFFIMITDPAFPSTDIYLASNIFWLSSDVTLYPQIKGKTLSVNDYTNPFFFNYNYDWFLNLVNINIAQLCSGFSNPIPAPYPYFSYDSVANRFSFNAPPSFAPNGGTHKLAINDALYSLFNGIPCIKANVLNTLGYTGSSYILDVITTPGGENLIPVYNNLATIPLVPTSYVVKMEQEYESASVWNPAVSVVFIAKYLPLIQNLEAKPYIYGFDPNGANNANVSNVLFELPVKYSFNPVISFDSFAEYVLSNLLTIVETGELQITAYWKDTYGNLIPFYLDVGSTFFMKILFRKKAFNY